MYGITIRNDNNWIKCIMGFWIRNAIIAVILIGLGVAFFLYQDVLLGDNTSEPSTVASSPKNEETQTSDENAKKTANADSNTTESAPKKPKKKSTNAAADGLSNFYAKVYGESSERKIRNNVIFLPEPEGDLIKILQEKKTKTRPFSTSWGGSKKSRPFRKGEALYQKLSEFSTAEGLDIIWWINKDFIVKDYFRINNNLLKTAKQVGQAIAGHFPEGVNCYFCYQQRTLVFVNEPPSYLNDECILL